MVIFIRLIHLNIQRIQNIKKEIRCIPCILP
jgi:hypothetical protein